jgi:hypothetical protein
MTCDCCLRAQANPLTGWFNLRCLDCCCRLIESTRPSVEQRELAFEAIARDRQAPTRSAIVARLKARRMSGHRPEATTP